MRLAEHLLNAERQYWLDRVTSGRSMQEIAKAAGLSYRQMYYHLRKVGVKSERKHLSKLSAIRGRLLSPEDSASLSLLSKEERSAAIGIIVSELRAGQSRAISRMRGVRRECGQHA